MSQLEIESWAILAIAIIAGLIAGAIERFIKKIFR